MRTSAETGFIGLLSKQTIPVGVLGGWGKNCVGLTMLHSDSPLCIDYITPQHNASKVELTLYFLKDS